MLASMAWLAPPPAACADLTLQAGTDRVAVRLVHGHLRARAGQRPLALDRYLADLRAGAERARAGAALGRGCWPTCGSFRWLECRTR
ncbi:hypothetical protein GCM10027318_42180 [Massilia agilis]